MDWMWVNIQFFNLIKWGLVIPFYGTFLLWKALVGNFLHYHSYSSKCVPAWAKGFDQDTSVFSMIGVTSLNPQFCKPEKRSEGEIPKCKVPSAVADSQATG